MMKNQNYTIILKCLVPGIDFSESFAPVLNDVSFRIMLIVKLVWDMTSTVVDIEKAFLHGDLDE
jgi:hypothetical protein